MFLNQSLLNKFNWQKWTLWLLFVLAFAWPRLIVLNVRLSQYDILTIFSCALFLSSPFFYLKPKWRWILLILIWLVATFEFVNVIYYNFFGDYIPIRSLFVFENFDPILFDAAIEEIKPKHLLVFISPIAMTIIWFLFLRKINNMVRFSLKSIIIASFLTISPCIFYEFNILKNEYNYHKSLSTAIHKRYHVSWGYSNMESYNSGGIIQYFFRGIALLVYDIFATREISDAQKQSITNFLNKHKKSLLTCTVPSEQQIFKNNHDKNLILIIVESLNSEAVCADINGHKLMPNLFNWISDSSTISCLNTVSQIKSGISSDGQLIINTGLYPSSETATALEYFGNDFPSLAKLLNRSSLEIICESSTMWRHTETNKSYGFNAIIDYTNRRSAKEGIPRDKALFKTGLEVLDTIPKPFFILFATIDMHSPYKSALIKKNEWIANSNLGEERKDYYNMCHASDSAMGTFISDLKKKGVYDNSIIIIASDHAPFIEGKRQEQPIVFMALNTGMHREVKEAIGQVDIFPTILDIMGRHDAPWRGMGYSIFDHPTERVDGPPGQLKPEVQELVNLMHFGNWYGNWKK